MAVQVLHLRSPIGALVTEPAIRVSPDTSMAEVCRIMQSEKVSAVIVGPGAAGIVTERDITRAMAAECPADTAVEEVATFFPILVDADMDVLDAAATMLNEDVRHLLVASGGGGFGIVSLRAILAVLLQAAQPDLWLTTLRFHMRAP